MSNCVSKVPVILKNNRILGVFIRRLCPKFIKYVEYNACGLIFFLKDAKYVNPFSLFLKKTLSLKFTSCQDYVCIDMAKSGERFCLFLNLLSFFLNKRIFISFVLKSNESVSTLSTIFKSIVWLEREIWDLFGIFFKGNKDLRRILTDYGFEGFPLRKDFPLSGYLEVRYDEEVKSIVYEPIVLAQAYRVFSFESPWSYLSK